MISLRRHSNQNYSIENYFLKDNGGLHVVLFVLAIVLNKPKISFAKCLTDDPSLGDFAAVLTGSLWSQPPRGTTPAPPLCWLASHLSASVIAADGAHYSTCLIAWLCAYICKAFITVPCSESYINCWFLFDCCCYHCLHKT